MKNKKNQQTKANNQGDSTKNKVIIVLLVLGAVMLGWIVYNWLYNNPKDKTFTETAAETISNAKDKVWRKKTSRKKFFEWKDNHPKSVFGSLTAACVAIAIGTYYNPGLFLAILSIVFFTTWSINAIDELAKWYDK